MANPIDVLGAKAAKSSGVMDLPTADSEQMPQICHTHPANRGESPLIRANELILNVYSYNSEGRGREFESRLGTIM